MNIFVGRSFEMVETSGHFPGDPSRRAKRIYKVVCRFGDDPNKEYISVRSFKTEEAAEQHQDRVMAYSPEEDDFINSEKWYSRSLSNASFRERMERAAQRERERRRFGPSH